MATLAPPILKVDLNLKQGVATDLVFTIVDTAGSPIVDTTGYTVRAQIRRTALDSVLFEWNTTPGVGQGTALVTYLPGPPATSTVTLTLTGDQTAAFAFTIAKWDLFLVNPIGQPVCLVEGMVRVDPHITH